MTNPYQSPRSDPSTSVVVRFNFLRIFFFLVNFAGAVTLFVMSVVSIVTMESLQSIISGLMCVFPSLAYGISEWVAYVRENRAVERKLAIANLGCAAFVAFGVASNVSEALMAGTAASVPLVLGALTFGIVVCGYLFTSGWYRRKWTR